MHVVYNYFPSKSMPKAAKVADVGLAYAEWSSTTVSTLQC